MVTGHSQHTGLWIAGREIFVGLSGRTNMLGAQAIAKAFPEYPTTIVRVYPPAVHLKDYISMAGPEVMAVGKSESAQKTFLVQFAENFSVASSLQTLKIKLDSFDYLFN
jgi:N-dimethylarginine dimethylaminohydrolase